MHDESEHRSSAPRTRVDQEADAAASAKSTEARLAHEKLAELHREEDRDPAGPADGARVS